VLQHVSGTATLLSLCLEVHVTSWRHCGAAAMNIIGLFTAVTPCSTCPQQDPTSIDILLQVSLCWKLVCIVWRTFSQSQQCSNRQLCSALGGEHSVCCRRFEANATIRSLEAVALQAVACGGNVHLQDKSFVGMFDQVWCVRPVLVSSAGALQGL
jgi:hypothetical protein